MPKGTRYDSSINAMRTIYYRSETENYGSSTIWLEPLNTGRNLINIEGQKVWLPVLDLRRYYPSAKCYAFVEKVDNQPITMVDILYTYEDILGKLESDGRYLERFLQSFSRIKINMTGFNSPALTIAPTDLQEKRRFSEAMKQAIEEACGNIIFDINSTTSEMIEMPDDSKKTSEDKQESIVVEFIKAFYDSISINPQKRHTDKKSKKIKEIVTKKAIMMKSGAIILPNKVVGKYYTKYGSTCQLDDEVSELEDTLPVYLENVNDDVITSNDVRRQKFGKILFASNILETYSYINVSRSPIFMFLGKYNEETERIEVSRETEKYFDRINELLLPKQSRDDEDTR